MLYMKSSKLTESTPHRSPVVDEAKLQRPAKCGATETVRSDATTSTEKGNDNPVVLVNNF